MQQWLNITNFPPPFHALAKISLSCLVWENQNDGGYYLETV